MTLGMIQNLHDVMRGRMKGRESVFLMRGRGTRLEATIWRVRVKLDKLVETGLNWGFFMWKLRGLVK